MTLALYGKSRKRQGGLLLAALLAIIGAAVGGLLLIGTAFAHDAAVSGTVTCNVDGTYTINWTIANDWHGTSQQPDGKDTLTSISLSAGSFTQNITPNPVPEGPGSSDGIATAVSTAPAGTSSVTLSFKSTWTDGYSQNDSGTVSLSSACATITIKKVVNPSAPSQSFTASIINDHGSAGEQAAAPFSAGTKFTETFANPNSGSDFTISENGPLPAGWTQTGWAVVSGGNGTCPDYSPLVNWTVFGTPKLGDLGGGSKTVCFRNTYTEPKRDVRVQKIGPPTSPGGSFTVNVGSGQFNMTLGVNDTSDGPTNAQSLPQTALALSETLPVSPAGWSNAGYYVKKRIDSNTKCSGTETYTALTEVPAGPDSIIICVKNAWTAQPSLSITKTADASPVNTGSTIGFTITVTNSGSGAASNVSLSDTLPAGNPALTWVVDSNAANTTLTGCGITGGNSLSCPAQTIPANSSKKVHVTAATTVTQQCAGQTLDNTAHISYNSQDTASNPASITLNCASVGAPGISKTQADPARDGSKAYWNITINNSASTVALTGVVVTDTGAHLESTTPANACTGTDNSFTCSVAAQGSTVLKVSKPLGDYTQCRGTSINNNSISVDIPGATPRNPTPTYDNTLITVPGVDSACGVPTISKSADPANSTTTAAAYKIVIDNSTSEVQRTVVVTDAGVNWPSPLPSGCNPGPGANQVTCVVAAHGTTTIPVTVAVTASCTGTEATNTATAYYLNDAGGQVTIPNTNANQVKSSSLPNAASCSKQVIFGKYVCNAYSDVEANEDAANGSYNDIGTLVTELKNPVLGSNDAVTPLNDGRTVENCHLEPWDFVLKDGNNTSIVTQNIHVGAALTPIDINAASMALALQPTRLRVEEVTKPGYGFAGIKCYTDHLHSDNWEWIDFSGGIPEGNVYCLAYNIKPPRTIQVCKVIDQNNDGIADDATFTFGVRGHGSEAFETVQLDAKEGGEQVCKTVTVPDNSQSSDIEVFEWGSRPSGWTDAQDFPKISVNGGALSSNGTADLGSSGNGTVTFHNKKASATQDVTFIKVICPTFKDVPANLQVNGIGWGTNDMPAGHDQTSLGAASPSGPNDAVSLNDIPANCVRVPGWSFDIKDSGGTFYRTVTTAGSIGSAGVTITLTAAELQSALQPWQDGNGYHGLYVSEQKQTGYGFAAMKCYKDHKLLDNTDGINLEHAGIEGVYCIAYNVADPVHVTVAKSNNLEEGGVSAGGSFDWKIDVTVSGSQTSSQVHVTDPLPLGFTVDSVVAGPEFNCTASTTTTVDCILAVGASVGTHSITVHVTAPKPGAEVCAEYKNTVTIANLAGNGGGEAAPQIPREQILDKTSADNTVNVVDCTGTIVVHKQITTTHAADGTTFSGTVNASSGFAWGPIIAGGSDTVDNVPAGSATVEENPSLNGWSRANSLYVLSSGTQSCPTDPAAYTATTVTVVANSTVHVCVLNDHAAEIVLRTLRVGKVILGPNPDNTATFGGTVAPGGLSWSVKNGAVQSFGNLDPNVYTVTETAKAGYTTLGYKVYYDGRESCPSTAPTSYDYTGSASAVANLTQNQTIGLVCVYNQPFGSITVTKTTTVNGVVDGTQDAGWHVTVSSATCAYSDTKTTNSSGVVAFTNLPTCNDYVVSEDVNSHGNSGFAPVGPSSYSGVAVTAGGNAAVSFTNNRNFNPCGFECTPVILNTPTPTTPTTPTATPVTPTATQPTATPTEPTKTEGPSTVETVSPTVQITLGEKTPGANATPLAPQTGSGLFGTGKSGSNLLLAVLGIFSLSAGFAVIAVANKNKSRS